jgi:adenosylhomocysteine nucleosidase
MIGIIGAMDIELTEIKKYVSNPKEIKHGIRTYTKGQIKGKDVVLVLAGVGKVNAAITASKLLEDFPITHIINIGVAGGQNGVSHKDLVISTEVLYHDVDVTSFGTYQHGQVPGMEPFFVADPTLLEKTREILQTSNVPYRFGKIASGDSFVTKKQSIQSVNTLYDDIYAIEMEAAAIAHTATLYQTPFLIIRSISDLLDDDNQSQDFQTFVQEASVTAATILGKLLEVLT